MVVLALGMAGAGIGWAVGGTVFAAQVGWAIGSMIGASLQTGDKTESRQERMSDLRVTGTEYGQPIPWLIGSAVIAGQMWWNTDRRAIEHTEEVESEGGKGGGGGAKQEHTTITYEMDALYGLTDNPILGVKRVFDNGKLVWDNTLLNVTEGAESEHWRRITVYTGHDDQLPDPLYEAAVGAGNAPAYRGRGTVFIESMQLGQSGSVRNLTFEVIADGQTEVEVETFQAGPGLLSGDIRSIHYDGAGRLWIAFVYTGDPLENDWAYARFDLASESFIEPVVASSRGHSLLDSDTESEDGRAGTDYPGGIIRIVPEWNRVYVAGVRVVDDDPDPPRSTVMMYTASGGDFIRSWYDVFGLKELRHTSDGGQYDSIYISGISTYDNSMLLYCTRGVFVETKDYVFCPTSDGVPIAGGGITGLIKHDLTSIDPIHNAGVTEIPSDARGVYWILRGPDCVAWGLDEDHISLENRLGYSLWPCDTDGHGDGVGLHGGQDSYDPTRDCIYYVSVDRAWLKRWDCTNRVGVRVGAITPPVTSGGGVSYIGYDKSIDKVFIARSGEESVQVWAISASSGTTDSYIDTTAVHPSDVNVITRGLHYANGKVYSASGVVATGPTGGIISVSAISGGLAPGGMTVADAQAAICERSGLAPSQYDVSGLWPITRDVRSLTWSQISPGREPTERLMSGYYYEVTVSDKIYFRARGGVPVATIPYLDLAARPGNDEPDEPIALTLSNDIELPAQVAVTYSNLSNDYQSDTQYSDRMISATAGTVAAVQMALGMTPDEAKGVADTMSLDQAASVVGAKISLLGNYARLEPTDVVTIDAGDGTMVRMRLVKKTDSYPLLDFEAVIDDPSVLSSQGITSAAYASSTRISAPAETLLQFLDIPILRDEDNAPGIYIAAKGATAPWAGGGVFSSTNNIDYRRVATISEYAVFGTSITVLGDWFGPRMVDEFNSVTVEVGTGVTLESSTRAAVLDSLSTNTILIGNEIVQYIIATLLSPGVYRLSRLLRGGRGTEWAMTDHGIAERCVLLRARGMRRVAFTTADLGSLRYYKGVTVGRSVSAATAMSFAGGAVGLKPFAPFDLRASRDSAGNITFTFQRRSRLRVRITGPEGISVPLGEESEGYQLDIYAGSPSAVVRTISATTTTATYPAAQQTADGVALFSPVETSVYQMSAVAGRGYELRATV